MNYAAIIAKMLTVRTDNEDFIQVINSELTPKQKFDSLKRTIAAMDDDDIDVDLLTGAFDAAVAECSGSAATGAGSGAIHSKESASGIPPLHFESESDYLGSDYEEDGATEKKKSKTAPVVKKKATTSSKKAKSEKPEKPVEKKKKTQKHDSDSDEHHGPSEMDDLLTALKEMSVSQEQTRALLQSQEDTINMLTEKVGSLMGSPTKKKRRVSSTPKKDPVFDLNWDVNLKDLLVDCGPVKLTSVDLERFFGCPPAEGKEWLFTIDGRGYQVSHSEESGDWVMHGAFKKGLAALRKIVKSGAEL